MSSPSHESTVGTAVGGTLGFLKSLTIVTHLSFAAVMDTAILSAVGALVGFFVTWLLKKLKTKIDP